MPTRKLIYLLAGVAAVLLILGAHSHPKVRPAISEGYTWISEKHFLPSKSTVFQDVSHVSLARTTLPAGANVHGFNVLDNLYMRHGIMYVITPNPSTFLPKSQFMASPEGPDSNLEPTDAELRYVTPRNAALILGQDAIRIEGFTVIFYDPAQYMSHYYHWWGEIILGFWRVYSILGSEVLGKSCPPPFPDRFVLPMVFEESWRDKAGIDGQLMRAAFPSASIETSEYWDDYASLNSTFVFTRAMIVNRAAAHRHHLSWQWAKMIASTMDVAVAYDFWGPVREAVMTNILRYVPEFSTTGAVRAPPQAASTRPVVTYISRQGGGRMLREPDHVRLVEGLRALEREGVCEVNVALMERMSLEAQIAMVARSTIIVGVHGNGLTHMMWMPPSAHSTVIEIVFPDAYTFDYEIIARNMGHKHYIVWNDTLLTYPAGMHHDRINIPEGFNENAIPVYGPAVVQTIRERLSHTT